MSDAPTSRAAPARASATDVRQLEKRIAQLEQALRRARRDAVTDALTGCLNRRGWEERLDTEERRCARHDLDAVVIAVDLDAFKQLNDTEGHDAGDRMLRRCADALKRTVREHDVVGRLGGDEFGIVAVQVCEAADGCIHERLAAALARAGVPASIGTATRAANGDLQTALLAADQQLRVRKRRRD